MSLKRASLDAGGLAVLLVVLLGIFPAAFAQENGERTEAVPAELEGLGIFPRNGESIPLDLSFTESNGQQVELKDFFDDRKPVFLTLVYYNCPMLCNILLDKFVEGLKELQWTAGQEFEIVTVSIDPKETPDQARFKKAHQIENYGRPSAAAGWHFLTGTEQNVAALADAVGFKYAWNEERQQFAHAAGIFVITPGGVISQTLLGLVYDEQTLRLALVEASEGDVGSFVDQALLFCFHYDAESGRYAPAAMNFMRLGGGLAAVILVAVLIRFWLRDRRRRTKLEGSRT